MLNKNLIIGIVVVALFGGGIVYFFSSGGGSVPNAPVSRQGELTRELAKQILVEEYKDEPIVYDARYDTYRSAYYISGVDNSESKQLANRGLITEMGGSVPSYFDFTEEGKKYLTEPNYKSVDDTKSKGVVLANFKNVEVVGIFKKSENEAEVQYEREYTLTPFGEVMEPDSAMVEWGATFRLYDDGWRL